MDIKKTFIYNTLSYSFFYDFVQWITGSYNYRKSILLKFIKKKNCRVLDIGCGTANILKYLDIDHDNYYGLDYNLNYINLAKKKFPKANFFNENIENIDFSKSQIIDYILLFGVIHHLSDQETENMFSKIKSFFKPGCKIITVDPVFIDNRNFIARFIAKYDRGLFVRYAKDYEKIYKNFFKIEESYVQTTIWPPANWNVSILKI